MSCPPAGTSIPLSVLSTATGLSPAAGSTTNNLNPIKAEQLFTVNNNSVSTPNTAIPTNLITLAVYALPTITQPQTVPVTVTITSPTIGTQNLYYLPPNPNVIAPSLSDYKLLTSTNSQKPNTATLSFVATLQPNVWDQNTTSVTVAYFNSAQKQGDYLPPFTFSIDSARYTIPTYANVSDAGAYCYDASTKQYFQPSMMQTSHKFQSPACANPSPTPNPNPTPRPSKKLSGGEIAGITIASAAVLVGIVLAGVYGSRAAAIARTKRANFDNYY